MKEGDAARAAVESAARRTTSRRDLGRHERFDEVSPEVGVLDPDAFAALLDEDPDEALALLADLNGATDESLRALAHRLSAQVVVDVARGVGASHGGSGRLERVPLDRGAGDLDLDASLDGIVRARAGGRPPRPEELWARTWRRTDLALCLLVDRSGSMQGERLATAAVTAAAVSLRAGVDRSVVAFAGDAVVVASQGDGRPASEVVVDLCRLRGTGVTDLGLALRVGADQLSRSRAPRRVAVLLSDCRTTSGGDPLPAARGVDELVVLAPADDDEDASAFAQAAGVRWARLAGPASAPHALDSVLR